MGSNIGYHEGRDAWRTHLRKSVRWTQIVFRDQCQALLHNRHPMQSLEPHVKNRQEQVVSRKAMANLCKL